MVEGAIISDFGGFADNHAHAVVDEETAADYRPGMDLDAGEKTAAMRNQAAQEKQLAGPEEMPQSIK